MRGIYQETISQGVVFSYIEIHNIVQIYVNDEVKISYELPEDITIGELAEIFEQIKEYHKPKISKYDNTFIHPRPSCDPINILIDSHHRKSLKRSKEHAF